MVSKRYVLVTTKNPLFEARWTLQPHRLRKSCHRNQAFLVHGCYWSQPSATPDVLSVPDRDTEKEEYDVQEGQPLSSPAATDATMADEEAVSVHSSSSESPTIPSTEQPEEDDARMEDGDSATTSSTDEGDLP